MKTECTFCKIVQRKIPGEVLFQDDMVTAFRDINPVAPHHILVVPNEHISSLNDLTPSQADVAGRMLIVAGELAEQEGIQESGYRLIINTGPDAGQVIFHLHLHIIGGQPMRYPMG
jgi:histidine triad (HIT) family protein